MSEKPDSPVLKSALKNNKKEEPKTKDKYNFSDDEEVTVKTETKQAKKSPAQKQYGFSDDEEQIYLKTDTKKGKKPQKLEMEEHSNSEQEELARN